MWLALLKRFWPYLAVTILLLSVWVWHLAQVREARQEGRNEALALAAVEIEKAREHWREIEQETQIAHQQQLEKIRANAARELRGRPIRCVLGDANKVRGADDPGKSADGSGGEPTLQPAADLRSRIVHSGETCEQLRQQVISIRDLQRDRYRHK